RVLPDQRRRERAPETGGGHRLELPALDRSDQWPVALRADPETYHLRNRIAGTGGAGNAIDFVFSPGRSACHRETHRASIVEQLLASEALLPGLFLDARAEPGRLRLLGD